MWPPLLSALFCIPAAILLFVGFFGNSATRRIDLPPDVAFGLPPVRQAAAIAISLPPAQLSTEPQPELDAWQVILADLSSQPPSGSAAEQEPVDSTLPTDATDVPPVKLEPAIYVRPLPAHPTRVRSVRASRRKDIALLVVPSPREEPVHRPPTVWMPPPPSGG